MNRIERAALLCVAIGLTLFGLASCKTPEEISYQQSLQNPKTTQEIVIKQELEAEERVLSTTGAGKVDVDPDIATVRLSVHVQAATAEEAQQHNSELMKAVLTQIKSNGIADADIKTQAITVLPVQENVKGATEITGYSATNTVSLKIRNVKKTNEVIDAAVKAGANVVLPLEFYLIDETKAYQQALALAVEDAYTKANIMAKAAGFELNGPKIVHENYDVAQNAPDVLLYEGVVPGQPLEEGDNSPAVPMQAGQLTVNAQVTIDFHIKWPPSATPKE